eukprot:g3459.t1
MKTILCLYILVLCSLAILGSARPIEAAKEYIDSNKSSGKSTEPRLPRLSSDFPRPIASNSGYCKFTKYSRHLLIHCVLGTASDRAVDNFKANGTVFHTVRCGSVSMCVQECLYRGPDCVGVNYGATVDYTCHLFSEIEGIYYAKGWQTALNVPDAELCEDKYLITGGWRNGRQSYGSPLTVSSATECCKKCTEINSCTAFDFDMNHGYCYLRTDIMQPKNVDEWTDYKNGIVCRSFQI